MHHGRKKSGGSTSIFGCVWMFLWPNWKALIPSLCLLREQMKIDNSRSHTSNSSSQPHWKSIMLHPHVASVCICLLYVAMLSLVISPNFTPSRTQSHRFVERRPQVHLPAAGRSGAGAGAPCVAYLGLVAISQDPAEVCCLQFFPLVA